MARESEGPRKLDSLTPEEFFRIGLEKTKQAMTTPAMEKIIRIIITEQFRHERARDLLLRTVREPLTFTEKVLRRLIDAKRVKPLDPSLLAAEQVSFFWNVVKTEQS